MVSPTFTSYRTALVVFLAINSARAFDRAT
jgi:hypothetical protein